MIKVTVKIEMEMKEVHKEQTIIERIEKGLIQFSEATKGNITKVEVEEN